MRNREIVGGKIRGVSVLRGEGRGWIIQNLGKTMILHHDDPDVVEWGHTLGHRAFLGKRNACGKGQHARK